MKIKIFLLLILISVSSVALAQVRERGDIELAPNIGYATAFLNGDNVEGQSYQNGLQFGAVLDFFFNDRWSLRTGASYMQMGTRQFGNNLELNYIFVPINANWHFGSTRKWNLNFGVSPSVLASAKVDGNDLNDFIQSFQLAFTYGIGYKIEVSDNFSILIDTQGILGLTNVVDESEEGFVNTNAGSSINVGAVFKL